MKRITIKSLLNFLLCFYIVLLPFEEAIAFKGITALRIISILIIFVCVLITGLKLKISSFIIPLTLWMGFSLLSFIWAQDISESWRFFKIYLIQFATILLLYSLPKNVVEMSKLYFAFIISGLIASTLIFVLPSSVLTNEGRRTIILFNSELDPNIVSSIIVIGILFSLFNFLNSNKKTRIVWLLIAGYEFLGSLYTGSRGGLFSFAIGFLAFLFISKRAFPKRGSTIVKLLLVLLVAVVALLVLPESLISKRFSMDVIFGQTEMDVHSRVRIWSYVPKLFVSRPVFGWGAGNFPTAISYFYRYSAGHNMFFIVLIETGLIGFVVFGWFVIKMLIDVSKRSYVLLPVIFAVLTCCMFLDGLTDKFFWAVVMLSALSLNNSFDCEEKTIPQLKRNAA